MSTIAIRPEVFEGAASPTRRRSRRVSRGGVVSCRPSSSARRASAVQPLQRVKVAAVTVIAAVGAVVGVAGYVDAVTPAPAEQGAAVSEAWAHVE